MQLTPDNLDAHLATQLAPVYFISGDEPLRVMEAADAIRVAARKQGYDEREVLTVQSGFDWDTVRSGADNLSLFSQRRLVELRLPTGKPGTEGARTLRDYTGQLPEDTLLLITAGKLDPAARKSKWVQALDRAGVVMFVWPLNAQEFKAWVAQRMRRRGLEATAEAVTLLAERVEGNLLACQQEIDKLYLLQDGGVVDADAVLSQVSDSARYDVYGLVDGALSGDAARSARILQGLCAEGVAPQVVVWALARDLRQLAVMTAAVATGQPVAQVLTRNHVWTSRKTVVGKAVTRLTMGECHAMLRQCAHIDRVSKGQAGGKVWDELLQLCLQLAGADIMPARARMQQVS